MSFSRGRAWHVVVIYVVIGAIWITFSDRLVAQLALTPRVETTWQTYKGLLFVGVTGALLLAERLRTEKRMYAASQHATQVLALAPLPIVALGADLTVTQWNAAARRLLGWEAEAVLTRPFPAAPPEAVALWQSLLAAPSADAPRLLELAWPRQGGDARVTQMVATAVDTAWSGRQIVCIFHDVHERRLAESALRESEERYRILVEAAPEGIAIHRQGKLVYVNSAGAALLAAASPDDLIGKPITTIVHPDGMVAAADRIQRMLAGESGLYPVDDTYMRLDGQAVPVEVMAVPTTWDGEPAIQVIVRDSSDRLAHENETRYQAQLLASLSDAVIATDTAFHVRAWNRAAETIYGWTADEAIGRQLGDLVRPEYVGTTSAEVVATFRAQGAWQGETIHHDKAGRRLWILGSVSQVLDASGAVTAVVSVNRDITERKQVEEQLRQSEARFRLLADQAQDLIYRYRMLPTPGFEYVSPSATAITGYSPADHYADPQLGYKLVHPDDRHLLERSTAGGFDEPLTLRWLHRDGRVVWTEQRNTPVYDEMGQFVALEGIARDVTQRELAAQALAELAQQQTALAAFGQHVLRGDELADLLHYALTNLTQLLGAPHVLLIELTADGGIARQHAAVSKPLLTEADWAPAAAAGTVLGQALHEGPDLVIWQDLAQDARFAAELRLRQLGVTAGMAMVVRGRSRPFGVLVALSTAAHAFSDGARLVFEQMAGLIGLAVARQQAEADLQQRLSELKVVHAIGRRLQQVLPPEILAQELVQVMEDMLGFEFGAVLLTEEPDRLVPFANVGLSDSPEAVAEDRAYLQSLDLRVGKGIVGWVAEHGASVRLGDVTRDPRYRAVRQGIHSELCVPLLVGEHVIGVVNTETTKLDAYTENDLRLLETVAAQIAIAIHNSILLTREQQSQDQLRLLTGYLQSAQETERARIAREIHDVFGQILTALKMDAVWLRNRLPAAQSTLRDKTEEMAELIDTAVVTVRRLASELRPGLLDDLGLVAAIEWQVQDYARRSGIASEVHVGADDLPLLDRERSTAVFRIVQESLTNAVRHAQATRLWVTLEVQPDYLLLTVRDNGVGISRKQLRSKTALGLVGMQERARAFDGKLLIHGKAGEGTTVTLKMPWSAVAEVSTHD